MQVTEALAMASRCVPERSSPDEQDQQNDQRG
jgi:hypothetical protein